MANNKWTKNNFVYRSPEEFELFLIKNNTFFNINLENREALKSISKRMSDSLLNVSPFGINQIRRAFTEINRKIDIKSSSELHVSYYTCRGYTEEYAWKTIIKIQRKRSKRCPEFWIEKGYSIDDALEKVSSIQRASGKKLGEKLRNDENFKKSFSVWSEEHWIKKGYSEEEARDKVKSFNPSCKEFYETSEAWELGRKSISKRVKKLWQNGIYDDKIKMIQTRYTSKQEKFFFELLSLELEKLVCSPFGVNVREFSDDFYYVFDAYYKSDRGIILFEYDGTYWHDTQKDAERDALVLKIRNDVIGIIRTNDFYFYNHKVNKNTYEDAIKKIESKESDRILLYESPRSHS